MRDGVVFLNSARAALHDTDALVGALDRARCPPPPSTTSRGSSWPPTIRCATLPSVVLTPHIGGATYDTETNHTRDHRRGPVPPAGRGPSPPHRQPRRPGPRDGDPPTRTDGAGPRAGPAPAPPARSGQRVLLDQRRRRAAPLPALRRLPHLRPPAVAALPRVPVRPTLAPEPVSGRATVVAHTVNVQEWIPGSEPYLIGLVAIDEQESGPAHHQPGGRGARRRPRPAWRSRSSSTSHDDVYLPLFRPAGRRPPVSARSRSRSSGGPSSPASASRPSGAGSGAPSSTSPSTPAWPPWPTPGSPGTTSTAWPPTRAWARAPRDSPDPTTPEVQDALRLRLDWHDGGGEGPGQMRALIAACLAVGAGLARHVLVYRTVTESTAQGSGGRQGIGGGGGGGGRRPPLLRLPAVDAPLRRGVRRQLDRPGGPAPDARVRAHPRAAGPDRPQRPAQRRPQPDGHLPGPDGPGRLPGGPHDLHPALPVRLRRPERRLDRPRGLPPRLRPRRRPTRPATSTRWAPPSGAVPAGTSSTT